MGHGKLWKAIEEDFLQVKKNISQSFITWEIYGERRMRKDVRIYFSFIFPRKLSSAQEHIKHKSDSSLL